MSESVSERMPEKVNYRDAKHLKKIVNLFIENAKQRNYGRSLSLGRLGIPKH